ncbi:hypothetical protein LguiB_019133 [Lonicera macranthoides]
MTGNMIYTQYLKIKYTYSSMLTTTADLFHGVTVTRELHYYSREIIPCLAFTERPILFPASLSGNIPVSTIGNLTHLKTLSPHLNSLSGLLPSDLPPSLCNLYLQGNHFSGNHLLLTFAKTLPRPCMYSLL